MLPMAVTDDSLCALFRPVRVLARNLHNYLQSQVCWRTPSSEHRHGELRDDLPHLSHRGSPGAHLDKLTLFRRLYIPLRSSVSRSTSSCSCCMVLLKLTTVKSVYVRMYICIASCGDGSKAHLATWLTAFGSQVITLPSIFGSSGRLEVPEILLGGVGGKSNVFAQ